MEQRRRKPRAAAIRGLLVLAAALLLPLAAMLHTPRPGAAQSTGQDSLWIGSWEAGHASWYGACANPSSPAAWASCFSSSTDAPMSIGSVAMTTDGVNVYYAGNHGGLSCPIADLGANCTQIMAGPWPESATVSVTALAAYDGQIWIGQQDGLIYRCPSNLPYASQDTPPSQCVKLDDAGEHDISSLLLANGRLYAGVACSDQCDESRKAGLLWSCDPQTPNSCFTLDSYGETAANSLAAGGGYLWAGLANGIVWQCSLDTANACDTFEKAGDSITSISYDGQGTLYAAVASSSSKHLNGDIWSCPTAYANGCSNVISSVNGLSVAAGAGSVFSFTFGEGGDDGIISYGTNGFSAVNDNFTQHYSWLLYIPAEGTAGVGGAHLTIRDPHPSRKLARRCNQGGKTPKAMVTVTGPHDFAKSMKVGVCGLVKGRTVSQGFDLLDPGSYTVTVKAGKHAGTASFAIAANATKPARVTLR